MALTFPRDMMSELCWESAHLVLNRVQQISRTVGGRVTAQDLAPSIWAAPQVSSYAMPLDDAALRIADFRSLRGAIHSFYMYDTERRRPVEAQTDGQYDLSAVTVAAISVDRTELTLTGLPATFSMTSGDHVSIRTSVGGRELVQILRAHKDIYDGMGTTPAMEVEPVLRPSVQVGDIVDLIKPFAEMRLEPGTLDDPRVNRFKRKIVFSATQVIR